MSSAGMCGLERGGELRKKRIKIVKKQKKITGKILLNKKSDFVIKNTFITKKI